MAQESNSMTVGELIKHLEAFPKHWELVFQGGLTFFRTKARGEELVQIEWDNMVDFRSDIKDAYIVSPGDLTITHQR